MILLVLSNPSLVPTQKTGRHSSTVIHKTKIKMKCIYCLHDKDLKYFQKREHVIPQCFGKFRSNLVLKGYVCDECNQFFGDHLELFWGRDSFESIERLRHGLKPKEKIKRKIRTKSKLLKGKFKGAIVHEVELGQSGNILVEKPVQAGFYNNKTNCYDYFEQGEIPTGKELSQNGYEVKNTTVILIADKTELKTLINELREKGITVKSESELIEGSNPGDIVRVETKITLDRVLMRGICKIAFNYLAFVAGKDFVLSDNFNNIRRFIRYDERDSCEFLKVNESPILYDDQKLEKFRIKITQGHLIVLGYKNDGIFSKLSLFNTLTYGIYLCKQFKGIYIPIKSGHRFDVDRNEVSPLFSVNKRLLVEF